ncbi:MAG: double-strand break repair helicase AddA [Litoreibacter sp.]
MKHDEATLSQIRAADPDASTWLSANAGSGKTRVLTDRVARLLLEGVPPQRVLCLTYTKAAAAEMQNRLFKRLGEWAMMPSAELQKNLLSLGVPAAKVSPDALKDARSLFAKAIETPGGLKIQTIHSFCAALLRRFPLEAGVSPAFSEMDDRSSKMLRADVLEQVAIEAPEAMRAFAQYFTGEDTDSFLQQIISRSEDFAQPLDLEELHIELKLPTDYDHHVLINSVFLGSEADLLKRVHVALAQSDKKTDADLAARLGAFAGETASLQLLQQFEKVMLTGATTAVPFSPKKTPPTANGQKLIGPDLDAYYQLRERVADARGKRIALAALEKTRALHHFASAFLPRFNREKEFRGWLDFDDLILRARTLLTDQRVASWVLFRLDGGIDHVLVDEAQDTSPVQWDVIKLLTKEFTSGEGAREGATRTIFVVGDQKQSIYSFQGADPAQFDENRAYFHQELDRIGIQLEQQNLRYSFRSSSAILSLVDTSFTPDLRAGMGRDILHAAFKDTMPGRVDLWDWIDAQPSAEKGWDKDWFDPVDAVDNDHHTVHLANRIADFIKDRLAHGQITQVDHNGSKTRRIRPDDFLILVQGRSTLFHEIISACKTHKLPIAGADRLRVGAELGVKDITALLKYLATPEDNLSLAAVLRSPLGGLSEAQLFELCHNRPHSYLRQMLDEHKEAYPEVYAMLQDLRDQSDYLRPYELLERLLTRHNGREKLLARLGVEADEGIAALLDLALQYENSDIPSLTGFLTWLASDEVMIKRQVDSNSGLIRVMTVHGAKGLEAPIVILPDTGNRKNLVRDDILTTGSTAMWKAKTGEMPQPQVEASDTIKSRQTQERMRLLYVAMTRAENQLIICGAGETPKLNKGDWYAVIEAGMHAKGAAKEGNMHVLHHGDWPTDLPAASEVTSELPFANVDIDEPLPQWMEHPVGAAVQAAKTLSPSTLGGSKALASPTAVLNEEDAKARGTAIHTLLEHLPQLPESQWDDHAIHLIGDTPIMGQPNVLTVAKQVLKSPHLKHIFSEDTLTEVSISGTVATLGHVPMRGSIDRLVITDDEVLVVDFKSNAIVPNFASDTPDGILRQMGAYLELLLPLYPNHKISLAILWTTDATLMPLSHDIVRNALVGAHIS